MKYFDVAIIGSGPSGASTAFYLGKKGISTAIIEKETLPRYKTCGGGFVFRGRKNMPFEIDNVIEREFFKVDSYFNNAVRNYILKKYGQRCSDLMVDILHGDKPFPTKIKEKMKAKIKEAIF
jgi:flavin-dependent dehydrogenase